MVNANVFPGNGCNGITLREWYAGQAMIGILSEPGLGYDMANVAKMAFQYADAMLAEAAKEVKDADE